MNATISVGAGCVGPGSSRPRFIDTVSIIEWCYSGPVATAPGSVSSLACSLLPAVESKLAGLIFTFAFDRTVQHSFVGNVRRVVEADGGKVLFVKLECSPGELERRITHPSRQRFGKLNSAEQFRELSRANAFVDPGIPADRLTVDITELSASEAAKLIASRLGLQ